MDSEWAFEVARGTTISPNDLGTVGVIDGSKFYSLIP